MKKKNKMEMLIVMEILIMVMVCGIVGYGVYSSMKDKVDRLEKERCPYGRACDIYDKKKSKEALDRVVNLLIRRVNNCHKGVCDGCISRCEKSEAIRVLNDIRKI